MSSITFDMVCNALGYIPNLYDEDDRNACFKKWVELEEELYRARVNYSRNIAD